MHKFLSEKLNKMKCKSVGKETRKSLELSIMNINRGKHTQNITIMDRN